MKFSFAFITLISVITVSVADDINQNVNGTTVKPSTVHQTKRTFRPVKYDPQSNATVSTTEATIPPSSTTEKSKPTTPIVETTTAAPLEADQKGHSNKLDSKILNLFLF